MMNWNGYGANSWGMGAMGLFWVLAVGMMIWLVLHATRQGSSVAKLADSPRTTLDIRFAAGEISSEQYVQARKLLAGRSSL